MSKKRFKELSNLSGAELSVKIRELEAELFQSKMKKVTGQLANTASLWKVRKDIARIKLIQGQGAGQGSK